MRHDGLTAHQHRIAKLVAEGLSDKAIADKLGRREQTVRFHVSRIVAIWQLQPGFNRRVLIANRIRKAADAECETIHSTDIPLQTAN